MARLSNKEFLFRFTKPVSGPVCKKEGDILWSRVGSKVFNKYEYFIFFIPRNDPQYKVLNDEYMEIFREPWNGEYVVLCDSVRFDEENEGLLRKEREETVSKWNPHPPG